MAMISEGECETHGVCVCAVRVGKMSAPNAGPAQNFYWFGKSKLASVMNMGV